MRMFLLPVLTVSVIGQSICCQNLNAQDVDPLEIVPGNTAALVRLAVPEKTLNSVEAFVNKVQPGFGALAKAQAMGGLGQAIYNPSFKGADLKKDWYAGVIVENQATQHVFLLIPTTNADELKTATGDEFRFLERDGWVVCSKTEATIEQLKSSLAGDKTTFASQLDDRSKKELMSSDIGLVINATPLKKTFATELESADETLDAAIEKIGEQIRRGNAQLNLDYVLDMYRDFGNVLLQAVRDSESAVVGIKITDAALRIEKLLTVGSDTTTDKLLKGQPTNDMSRLASVPEGLHGYWAISGDPAVLMDWSERLMATMFKGDDAEGRLKNMMKLMREVKFGALSGGMGIDPNEEVAFQYFGVSELSPVSKVRESFRLIGDGMEYEVAGIRQKHTLEISAEEIDGHSVDIFQMQQTIPKELDPLGMQAALNKKMYGADGIVQRIVTQDELMFQTMGGGQEAMKTLLATKPWSDSKLLDARARQHENANLIVLGDLPNGILNFARLILGAGVLPVPVAADQLDGLRINSSYAGFSAAAESQRLHTRMTLPIETFQGFAQIGMFVQQMLAGGN